MRSKAVALVAVALALGLALAGRADALTLMVNGDTPSVRYQRWVDEMRVPTPNVIVTLKLVPDAAAGRAICIEGSACAFRGEPPTIVLPTEFDPPGSAALIGRDPRGAIKDKLFHEAGHLIDRYLMTDANRDRFRMIIRDARPWRTSPDSPHEQFAEAAAACAWPPALRDRATYRRGFYPDGGEYQPAAYYLGYGAVLSRAQLFAACGLIRSLA